ncbi:MAG: PilZ domain-containing protein [Gemmataceae bacterium]
MLFAWNLAVNQRMLTWGAFVVGALLGCLAFNLLSQWIQRIQDRREALRRWGNPVSIWLLPGLHEHVSPVAGLVVNRSPGGLGIVIEQPFKPGEWLRVRAASASLSIPWVAVRVRHCEQYQEKWIVGCQFSQTQPKHILATFG